MAKSVEIQAIESLVQRASRRLRWQGAFEGAATATVLAAAAALTLVFLVRAEYLATGAGVAALLATPLIVILGGALGARRRQPDETVARRVDRASGLDDRLSTAIAFTRMMERGELTETGDGDDPAVTAELMRAAIRDGVAAVPRARVEAATPFRWPRDLRAALAFTALCALVAGVALPSASRGPRLLLAAPDHAPPGALVSLRGEHLLSGAELTVDRALPANGSVFLGEGATARPVQIKRWTAAEIAVEVPAEAPLGETRFTAYLGKRALGPVRFVVVDARDQRFHKEDAVALEDPELEYLRALLSDIRMTAEQDNAKELEEYAAKIEKLLEQAERGELTKEQLLRELERAQTEMDEGAEPSEDEVAKQLAETGKELEKNELTRDLGKALQKSDLEEASKELEKLADKLDKKELSEKEQEKLAKTMEQVAKQFEKKQQDQQQKQEQARQDLEEQVRRLEKEKQEAKNDREREDAERRLEKKKDELARLEKKQEERDQSMQREAVKRLHKDLEKAAEQLQKPDQKDQKDQKDQDDQDQQQQASRNLKDAARETGRVEKEQRKQAAQKKVASQMEDLKEAMRRAKQKGNKGPQNPFGKDQKQSDFMARARGQQGSRTAWKPGAGKQGKGQGQGQGQGQSGQGQGQGQNGQGQGQDGDGQKWGTGHDDNLTGDATAKGGHTKDEDLQGVQGKGPSRRETILSAAQKGFASAKYQEVYTDYKRIVEEVMRSEKVPASYKYYVKRYFNQIKPKN
ncbi:MAG TPA: hypothetical protein PKU97_05835 [Kofleriaceae bacterium]|nr:hypothetical protein [Kofleriaceae bacterium]